MDPKIGGNMDSKEAILQSSYHLFSQNGFSGTSVKMIAQTLNISTSLIFHHFKSKEALWVSVEKFAADLQKNTVQIIREDTLEHFLSDILKARIEWYHDETFRKFFHWRSLEKNIQDFASLAKSENKSEGSILNIPSYIERMQAKGLIKKTWNPQVVATMIFCNSSYAVWDYADYYSMTDAQIEQFKKVTIQMLLKILKD